MSYAYFSSFSSLDSCKKSLSDQEPESNHGPNDNCPNQNKKLEIKQSNNPFLLLKLESKEELKKESRNECRERIFYKIKKVNDVEQVLSECESISDNIQQQFSSIL